MPSSQPLALADYVTSPRVSVSSAVALGIALLAVVPTPAPKPVRIAANRLRGSVVELQHAWGVELDAATADTEPRDADLRVDRALRATSMRLMAYAVLAPEHVPQAAAAKAAHERLFRDGLRFINLPYPEQWAHVERLITAIDEDAALAADLEVLVGAPIMDELRAAQVAYGEALGITAERVVPEAAPIMERLAAVRAAVVGYALQIVAMQDVDPKRIEAARRALAPIDALRERQARRSAAAAARASEDGPVVEPAAGPGPSENDDGGDEDASVTPTTPVPAVEEPDEALEHAGDRPR